jgi:hypothetical protein
MTARGFELRILAVALLLVGVDLAGPFSQGKWGVQFAVVAVDYFTKWAEVKALLNITAKCIEKFL